MEQDHVLRSEENPPRFKSEHTSLGVRVGIRMGFRVSGCVGVWVCWCLVSTNITTCLPLPVCLPWVPAFSPWVPACLGLPAFGACIRQNSLLSSFPVRSELMVLHHTVSGKRKRRTLLPSVHSSKSGVGIRSHHASDPLLVFAAVKKMAPSSREALSPEVLDECPFSAPSPRGAMVQKSHTFRCLSV